jgi:hypothetical protein
MIARLATLSAALAAVVSAGPTIHVSPKTTYQKYDGTGVAEAFQRSLVLHQLDAKHQAIALDYLFSNKTGAGFTILRNGLGSSPTDPFDHMKSIAPLAPRNNHSAVSRAPFGLSAIDAKRHLAQLHSSPKTG